MKGLCCKAGSLSSVPPRTYSMNVLRIWMFNERSANPHDKNNNWYISKSYFSYQSISISAGEPGRKKQQISGLQTQKRQKIDAAPRRAHNKNNNPYNMNCYFCNLQVHLKYGPLNTRSWASKRTGSGKQKQLGNIVKKRRRHFGTAALKD